MSHLAFLPEFGRFLAILGTAIIGIEDKMAPPPTLDGNAYEQDLKTLLTGWADAIDLFESNPLVRRIFPDVLVRNLAMTHKARAV